MNKITLLIMVFSTFYCFSLYAIISIEKGEYTLTGVDVIYGQEESFLVVNANTRSECKLKFQNPDSFSIVRGSRYSAKFEVEETSLGCRVVPIKLYDIYQYTPTRGEIAPKFWGNNLAPVLEE